MSARPMLFGLLAVVATAAAVLSFAALDELGAMCGFGPLSPLLPVVVDAGAAAGSVAWLSRTPGPARVFGRALALVLLAGSVAGNALSHGLSAYALTASWWVVVAVSAVPPAVLGAVVHLATLTAQGISGRSERDGGGMPQGSGVIHAHGGEDEVGTTEVIDAPDHFAGAVTVDRAAELLAEGAGRRRLAKELGVSEYEARQLMQERRNGHGVTR